MVRERGIRLSPKHGVNPMIVKCYYCLSNTGELALLGQLPGDKAAPTSAPLDKVPCQACAKYMKGGVILISVRDDQVDGDEDPYRTGAWCVVRDDFLERVLKADGVRAEILQRRVAFVPDAAWAMLGLPRGEEVPPCPGQ